MQETSDAAGWPNQGHGTPTRGRHGRRQWCAAPGCVGHETGVGRWWLNWWQSRTCALQRPPVVASKAALASSSISKLFGQQFRGTWWRQQQCRR